MGVDGRPRESKAVDGAMESEVVQHSASIDAELHIARRMLLLICHLKKTDVDLLRSMPQLPNAISGYTFTTKYSSGRLNAGMIDHIYAF
jgi:hypothetical protein